MILTAGAMLAVASVLAVGGGAGAQPVPGDSSSSSSSSSSSTTAPTTVAPVAATTTQVTLPLLMAPLVVDISTDPGGGLVQVDLNPSADYTATVKPNKVTFVNDAGTVKVKVQAKKGGQRVEARAATLADISGAGTWVGDVFETGAPTTVNYTIAAAGDGGPNITGISVTPASGVEFSIGAVKRSSDDDDEMSASVRIEFSSQGQTRTLKITAKVETDGDDDDGDEMSAKLSISLSRIQGGQVSEGAGAKTWSGMLCDGTTATIGYTVGDDGSIGEVTADPPADVRTDDDEVKVTFADGERVKIETEVDSGVVRTEVSTKIRCDKVTPGVNTDIATTVPDDDDDDDHPGRGNGGDDDRDDDDDRDEDDDDARGGEHGGGDDDGGDRGGDDD
jgi:hypothetical protein